MHFIKIKFIIAALELFINTHGAIIIALWDREFTRVRAYTYTQNK